jgi:hypothetical protein
MQGESGGFGRIVGELVLITTSILLAFALEAWWSERSEQREFTEVIGAIRAEFVGARNELDRARTVHAGTAETLTAALGLMGPSASEARGDSLLVLWPKIRFTSTDPPQGVLANALARGDVAALDAGQLRATLSSWPSKLEDYLATEEMYEEALDHVRFVASRLSPIPAGSGDTDHPTAFPVTPTRILTDFESENAMARARLLLGTVIRENDALRTTVAGVITDLDGVIEGR